ncbi:hypothetical protein PLESTB_000371000 [Pleodorina starrii]|uniref:Uncharacterized protein n=1 Tax=Pleodorina starrii TaxID=330485 RepID=A0A9W6BEK5_9CHLO|nr:hypothetical protein PLESTM_000023900 [Pleodorina starrii]GLC50365.1 hypothetical protein PLESTB_000371000 [Pleodorina starrii]GLC64254.1 hypothetical protein PLESTF_000141800 [Pleodorina starrii]
MDLLPRSSTSFEMERAARDVNDRRIRSCLHRATTSAGEDSNGARAGAQQPIIVAGLLSDRGDGSSGSSNGTASDSSNDGCRAHGAGAALRYTVTDVPPWHVCVVLGFQHYLTMLGSTIVIPALLVPAMGGTPEDHARVVQTIFFVSGLNTLIQTTIGDRLPIVQGGSFSFLKPAFSIIAVIAATRSFPSEHDRFVYTMRELQGSIIGSSLIVMAIGYSGAMGALLSFVSPVVVAPTVCMVGLSLYSAGFPGVADCIEQGLLAIVAVILFSQVLKKVELPLPRWLLPARTPPSASPSLLAAGVGASSAPSSADVGRAWRTRRRGVGGSGGVGGGGGSVGVRIFELFPLLWSILLSWAVAGILTAAGVYDKTSPGRQASCRTDNLDALKDAPWVYVPFPLQWGPPIFRPASVITMLAGALAAMIESTGDYYACARMCGAPVPPPYIISRGIGAEGLGCLLCGLFGTGNGTTSYAENIGAIGLTGVGSRRVVQAGAAIMLFLAVFGKFGGLFASLPASIVAGLFCCVFGLIAAVGLSNLQFTDQNSSRNLFIVGFAIYMALSVPYYFESYTSAHKGIGPIATSSQAFNDIANTLFTTPMCVALICAFVLDNTIAGTPAERGLTHWSVLAAAERKRGARGGGGGGGGSAAADGDGGGSDADGSGTGDEEGEDEDEDDPALDPRNDPRIKAVYDLPYFLQPVNDRYILPYRRAAHRGLRRLSRAVRRRWQRLLSAGCICGGTTRTESPRRNSSVRVPTSAPGLESDVGGVAGDDALGSSAPYGSFTEDPPFIADEEAVLALSAGAVKPGRNGGVVVYAGGGGGGSGSAVLAGGGAVDTGLGSSTAAIAGGSSGGSAALTSSGLWPARP